MPSRVEEVVVRTFAELPGVELRSASRILEPWIVYASAYSFCALDRTPAFAGEHHWRYRRVCHQSGPGSTMLCEPEEAHVTTRISAPANFHLLLVTRGALGPETPRFREAHLRDVTVYARFQALWAALEDDASEPIERQHHLRRYLELTRHRAGEAGPAGEAAGCERAVRRARDYIEVHHAHRLCLDDVAAAAGVSKFHLERSFRSKLGIPVWELVKHVRTQRAMEQLRRGHRPADVATLVGFADQAHMTRIFRELHGFTPGHYRRACAPASVTRQSGRQSWPPGSPPDKIEVCWS